METLQQPPLNSTGQWVTQQFLVTYTFMKTVLLPGQPPTEMFTPPFSLLLSETVTYRQNLAVPRAVNQPFPSPMWGFCIPPITWLRLLSQGRGLLLPFSSLLWAELKCVVWGVKKQLKYRIPSSCNDVQDPPYPVPNNACQTLLQWSDTVQVFLNLCNTCIPREENSAYITFA